MKKKSHMLGTVPKSNRKSTERAKIDYSNTQLLITLTHNNSLP
jgi:hypothetical protein